MTEGAGRGRGSGASARSRSDRGRRPRRGAPGASAGGSRRAGRGPFGPLGIATTRRAAVLAIVVCALALSVAVPLRTYLSQRSEVQTQERRQDELRHEVARLEQRKAELSDPSHVLAEARSRLLYVMPGETPYRVQLPGDAGTPSAGQAGADLGQQPWFQSLWNSMTGSGR